MATLNCSTTLFVVILGNIYTAKSVILIMISVIYLIYGFGVAVYLYGRKTYHQAEQMMMR
jgi:NADH:ubiquinone oxidoreductase subunit K